MAPLSIRRRMTRIAAVAAGIVIGGMAAFQPIQAAYAQGPVSVADLAEGLADAVVNISTAQTVQGRRSVPMPQVPEGSPFQEFFEEFFNRQNRDDDQPRRVQSLGSGFVIDGEAGIIITNNHVIEGADEITANFNDGTKLKATLLGTDEKTDLAVLQVEPTTPLKAVSFGDSDAIRVGDWVMAIGNPFGLGGTVTVGIVSARNRDINSGPYDNFIQTDASINRGNSGGPLFDMEGNVIGINTAIISPSGGSIGIGFAIPANTAMNVIDQLRKFGETRRGWLGVRIQEVTDEIADSLAMDKAMGALVAGVTDDGPAAKAKIEPGDVIIKFDGKDVDTMRELPRMVAETEIGKEVEVTVLRKGEEVAISVILEQLVETEVTEASATEEEEPAEKPVEKSEVLGMSLAVLDDALRKQFSIDEDVSGVVVTEVKPGTSAEEKRVMAGDVIKEVAQETVETPEDVMAEIDKLKKDNRRSALLLLANPTGDVRFVPVRIEDE
ncbi:MULTISPECIES: DegQ family serine endoprotease [Stappiaceae]|jgi:serine protease Do|uniref:Probable periplasmic serine endoprotease DegP-like n=2 Tax=Roseibium TaxID=150830 RepID=A0A0M6XZP2_9HYPH|nr:MULTISPECIES: DegQ family serine endoprotease [Stappiaceae]MCR9284543.1 DegQ family serine endoprotease [Paracoccaceae bacterium]MEC9417228.1 DegQ family serine endoprotease [Pseudomonadota bacterium]AMN52615.1 serine protease [Labrenzia sp. CP4]AQQ05812.1 serine protease [Roseibium aggregatum]MBN8181949.1 DegQ family serine endoprotease [Roseibium aggregatum]